MKQKPIVLIDLDDTLNNLLECWISLYNEKYDDNLDFQSIQSWDVSKYAKPDVGEDIYELLKTPGLFSEMVQPKPGSVKATEILSKYYDLYIVTACTYPQNIIEKYKWTEKYYPHISTDNIITAKNKSLIIGDFIIDDYHNNIITSKCDKKILFTMPHNMFSEIGNDIIRVPNWDEILWYFCNEENEELKNDVVEYITEKTFKKK